MFGRIAIIATLGLAWVGIGSAQNGTKKLALEDIIAGKFQARSAGYGMRSTHDGVHYTMISPERTAILRYSFSTGKLVDTLFSVHTARESEIRTFDDYEISSDGNHMLIFTDTESIYRRSSRSMVYHYNVRRNLIAPLSQQAGKVMIPTFSPDGRMVAFVRDGNIFIKKFEFDTEVQVTMDGKHNHIINGATDWVYEEELTATRLMSWSEDGEALAFVKTDESAVPEYKMPMYLGNLYPKDYSYKYPMPGEENSKVSVHVYYLANRNQKQIQLPDAYYIPRIEFTGRGGDLAVFTLNRRQNDFQMYYVNYKSLMPKLVFSEKSKTYIDSDHLQSLRFTPKGFAYVSEADGYAHLYLYSDRGTLERRITKGMWDVNIFYGIDAGGNAYYQAADEHPTRRNIYRVDPKGKVTKLMTASGVNRALFSSNYQYYIGTHSALNDPTETAVYRTGESKPLRVLEDNGQLRSRRGEYSFALKEMTTTKLADGTLLNGWMLKPKDFDPSKKYPLVMLQYSGPNSQLAIDSYGFGWEYYLASRGYVVVCFDGRGTASRGEAWRKGTYLNLGEQESADQIAAARSLGSLSYIDPARIAIWGWSYGGYNTLMSLCHGDGTFKLGIAVAPVTDWRYYDTIYTERYMRTPQENPEGYRKSSVLESAHKLKGRLLLIHGSADDNVHLQNSMELSERLVQANIPFDMAIYTDKDHSIRGGNTSYHIYSKMAQYIIDHL